MHGRIRRFFFLALLWPLAVAAQSDGPSPEAVRTLIPRLLPVAEAACAAVTTRTGTTAHALDRAARQALSDIGQMGDEPDLAAIRARLDQLTNEIGPLDAFPMLRLHFLLGHLAGREGNTKQQAYHRAYALALTQVMERHGYGDSEEHALRPCLIANEYDWLQLRAGIDNPGSQSLVSSGQHHYDVFHSTGPGDTHAMVYFDVTDIMKQTERVLSSGDPGH